MAYHSSLALSQNYAKLGFKAASSASMQLLNPGKFLTRCPAGFEYNSYNPRVQPAIWPLMRYFEMSRAQAFWATPNKDGACFMDLSNMKSMVYIVAISLRIEPELYNQSLDKNLMEIDNEVVQVGKTSFKLRSSMNLSKAQQPVARMDGQYVIVDQDTRRPSSPPVWWHKKYSTFNLPGEERVKVTPFDFSTAKGRVLRDEFCVRSSDIDPYCHVNHANFVQYCYEAYISWHHKQFGYCSRADPFRNIKNMDCTYKGEAGLGDALVVEFVQDAQYQDAFHFQVLRNSDGCVFQCSMEFYPQTLVESKY